jgi:hypothetical protein
MAHKTVKEVMTKSKDKDEEDKKGKKLSGSDFLKKFKKGK